MILYLDDNGGVRSLFAIWQYLIPFDSVAIRLYTPRTKDEQLPSLDEICCRHACRQKKDKEPKQDCSRRLSP